MKPKQKTDWTELQQEETATAFGRRYTELRTVQQTPECWESVSEQECANFISEMHADMTKCVQAAADSELSKPPPTKRIRWTPSETTNSLFAARELELQGAEKGSSKESQTKRKYRHQIVHSVREDKREWYEAIAAKAEAAANCNNSKEVWEAVRMLSGGRKFGASAQPTIKRDKTKIDTPEDLLSEWEAVCGSKFACTTNELSRPELPDLGSAQSRASEPAPSEAELMLCLQAAKRAKATGKDEIPVEVFLECAAAQSDLFTMLGLCWRREVVPESITEGNFVTFWKPKGSKNGFTKYRCICLLNSCYKLLSAYLLLQLVKQTQSYLSESQAGFRKRRGCRDNIYILSQLIKLSLSEDSPLVITFIDYVAAFDIVSHKFLESVLEEAGQVQVNISRHLQDRDRSR